VKSKLTFVVILALLGLLTSLLVSIPMLSATDGVAAILDGSEGDAITWTNPGDTIFLSLTDSDLNVASTIVDNASTTALAGTNQTDDDAAPENAYAGYDEGGNGLNDWIFAVATDGTFYAQGDEATSAGRTLTLRVSTFPILDGSDADDVVTFADVAVGTVTGIGGTLALSVFSVNAAEGLVTLKSTGTVSSADADLDNDGTNESKLFKLTYDAGAVDTVGTTFSTTTSVVITSEADPVGIGVVLTETGADTGIFEEEIGMCTASDCSDATSNPPVIEVSSEVNDIITLDYDDADADDADSSATISVESVDPEFDNLSPDDGSATKADRPQLSGNVSDDDSGVLQDEDVSETITFVMRITDTNAGRTVLGLPGSVANPRTSTRPMTAP